ncbi:T9SS type A sorting domain-containing protein [Hymenobacter sp. BT683]|uniref:T9SS type A sorting domain-containing protein n=1 Tax=Hymenobacter jeongseonensis TaxID=2791027 RepID=A0ABS0IFB7_9BACT|nr:T9SS type A sorting domain-containing protein [Hymenobacter jeongseonensis]MBF9237045.1 T9SS type A sorting domain-containing protein [Hymenobacter jeongseonensis]
MRLFYTLLVTTLWCWAGWQCAAQQLDPSFAPSTLTGPGNGIFAALKQPDGKVLISGSFQLMNGQASPRVARLNADGSPDLTFRAQAGSGPNGNITALALQPDGKILLGAEHYLTSYNGAPAQSLLRLNANGSLDTSFGSGGTGWLNGAISSIAVQADGHILVGGELRAQFNGQPTKGLIRLLPDGRPDASFSTGSGFVNSTRSYGEVRRIIVQPDGHIVAAGQFDKVDGQASTAIVRLMPTGARDASFASPLVDNALVSDMLRQPDGKILVGGNTLMGPANGASMVARLLPTGALDPAFSSVSFSGAVLGLGLRADGSVLVSGAFNVFGGLNRNGLARLSPAGTVDATFATNGGAYAIMNVVELTNGNYLAAGFFTDFGGVSNSGLARLLPNGTADATYSLLLETIANAKITPQNNGQLVLSAPQTTFFNGRDVSSQSFLNFHRINANGTYNSPLTLPPGSPRPNGGEYSYTAFPQADGTFYATYQNTDSTVVVRRILADGTFDPAFAATVLQWKYQYPLLGASVAVHPGGGLLVAGDFYRVNGQPRKMLARLQADGTLNTQFAPPTSAVWQVPTVGTGNTAGFRQPLGLANGQTLVLWNDATRSYIARLSLNGTVDNTFSIGTGGGPNSLFNILPLAGGKILVNGDFTSFNGHAAPFGLLRLLPNGTPDANFTAANAASTFAEQPDGKLTVVGPGATAQTQRLARFTATGSLDPTFQPVVVGNESFSPAATAVCLQPGTNAMILSGDFTSVAGQPRFGLARLINTVLATRGAATPPLVEAFPNPTHGWLQLRLSAPPTGPLTLTDLQGRVIRRWLPAQVGAGVSVAGLAPGIYVLRISTAAGTSQQRIAVAPPQ